MIPGSVNALLLASAASTGYNVQRSLRFNSSDSAYLSRTPSSAGNRKTWTLSFWVKRGTGNLNGTERLGQAGTSISNVLWFGFTTNGVFQLQDYPGSSAANLITNASFRDTSAWYHWVISVDTTQATPANRIKIYVNSAEQTFSTASYPTQNADLLWNAAHQHDLGCRSFIDSNLFNGYLANVEFVDGQQLTPSSFTEVSATTGQLIPKAYTGSFGTNGFWLKFSDNSAATATTLGKDYSGNSNNWTPNNLSVTAGAGNDSLVDTPTSYGTDTGVGGEVRGNYATLNNLLNTSGSYANGNLERTSDNTGAIGTICPASGKWYAEFTWTAIGSAAVGAIVTNLLSSSGASGLAQTWQLGSDHRGSLYNAGSTTSVTGWTTNDVIGLAFDCSTGAASFYKNGTLLGTITNSAFANVPVGIGACGGGTAGTNTFIVNFGQRPFAFPVSGFKALCDTNLPAPVVAKGSSAFDVKLYTGNGSTQTISGLSFSPDLVWIKERNAAADHALYDSVRGVQQQLESNTTTDETTESTGLTAFNSDGFALSSLAQVNTNTDTYVAWCWNESATAGFDIVTYTGNGSARTISHGLGVAPNMIIVKARTTASTDQGWPVYHSANTAAPATDYLLLDSTAATADLDTVWNDTAPTSSVFSVGTNALVNTNNDTYVAYLFSAVVGYSNGFSYTGNGSTDGSFVYLGFRPRLILLKCSSTTGNWTLLDTAREGYNVDNDPLYPNLNNAEGTTDLLDITSNGFKLRTTDASVNSSGATYVGFAWAESPFQYARAR